MVKWLITAILEKKKTLMSSATIELRTREILEKEFSDEEQKAEVKEIQVGEIIG